jgi:hypothetical protein
MTDRYTYRIAGRRLSTAVPLPELRPTDGPADFRLEFERCTELSGRTVRQLVWSDAVHLEISRSERGWGFVFPGTATFCVDPSMRIVCEPAPGTAAHTVRHLLVDQVVPLLLAGELGETVLHASAVAVQTKRGARAFLFVGDSGTGKSTTATALARLGATLLADDFAVVTFRDGRFRVVDSGVGVRLWPATSAIVDASVTRLPVAEWHDKERLLLTSGAAPTEPVELAAVVRLDARGSASDPVVLRPAGLVAATALLLDQSYRPDTATSEANAHVLQRIAKLVETVPVVGASMPHTLTAVTGSCRQLLNALCGLDADRTLVS